MRTSRRQLLGAASAAPFACSALAGPDSHRNASDWIAPPALRVGDNVMFVAPAGPVDAEKIKAARSVFESRGINVVIPDGLFRRRLNYLAGSDSERLKELNTAIEDRDIAGIFPCRGGYGLTRILDRVDYGGIRKCPKIIAGFSDITALHLAIGRRSRVITFHSPMPQAYLFDRDEAADWVTKSFWDAILKDRYASDRTPGYDVELPRNCPRPRTLVGGKAEGRLSGGNLTLINSTLGTPFQVESEGRIMVLEDVGEEPYRIDRYLSQLRLAGILNGVSGIVVGSLTDSTEREPQTQNACREIFAHYFSDLGIPVVTHFPVGHTRLNVTIPMGARARLDADNGHLSILENPVAL